MSLVYRSTAGRRLTVSEGDLNIYQLSQASGQTFVQSGSAPQAETTEDALRRFVFAAQYTGYDATGTIDSTTAFNNARTQARAIKARLRITGTPLISSALTVSTKEHWVFDGANGNASGNNPDSYLIKASTLNADLVTFTAQGSIVEGGGIVGQAGNGGSGYVIAANSISLINPFVSAMGDDGIRIGTDAGANSNSAYLVRPVCRANTRYGFHLKDTAGSSPNANTAVILAPFAQANGSHGIYINNAKGNTIVGVLSEGNTGWGIYLDEYSGTNHFYGGDSEGNTAGAIFTAVENGGNGFNMLDLGIVSGTITNNGTTNVIKTALNQLAIAGTWTPAVAGATVTVNSATYFRQGKFIHLAFDLTWPATADTTDVVITGMGTTPGASADNGGTLVTGYTSYTSIVHGVAGSAGISLYGRGGAPSTTMRNVDLSGLRLIGSCTYRMA